MDFKLLKKRSIGALSRDGGKLEHKLALGHACEAQVHLTEAQLLWEYNEGAIATEKLAEEICQFARDQEKLESLFSTKLQKAAAIERAALVGCRSFLCF